MYSSLVGLLQTAFDGTLFYGLAKGFQDFFIEGSLSGLSLIGNGVAQIWLTLANDILELFFPFSG